MPIAERIVHYSVWVGQTNYLGWTRNIRLDLESGGTIYLGFPPTRPVNWLELTSSGTNIFMTADQYDDVYHLLQTEDPVFCTALTLFGFQVGAVHTELDLSKGEPTGEGYQDTSLEALVVRAQKQATSQDASSGG
jgi:hypothetical protein